MKTQLKNKNQFADLVQYATVGKKYTINNRVFFSDFEIQKEAEGYTWSLTRNYDVSGGHNYIFPTVGQMVKYFKTEIGAKRNLINYAGWAFENK